MQVLTKLQAIQRQLSLSVKRLQKIITFQNGLLSQDLQCQDANKFQKLQFIVKKIQSSWITKYMKFLFHQIQQLEQYFQLNQRKTQVYKRLSRYKKNLNNTQDLTYSNDLLRINNLNLKTCQKQQQNQPSNRQNNQHKKKQINAISFANKYESILVQQIQSKHMVYIEQIDQSIQLAQQQNTNNLRQIKEQLNSKNNVNKQMTQQRNQKLTINAQFDQNLDYHLSKSQINHIKQQSQSIQQQIQEQQQREKINEINKAQKQAQPIYKKNKILIQKTAYLSIVQQRFNLSNQSENTNLRYKKKRSKNQLQQRLYQIIYGQKIMHFIDSYYKNYIQSTRINQFSRSHLQMSTDNKASNSQQQSFRSQKNLVGYLSKSKIIQQLSIQNVNDAIHKRLVIIMLDTLILTLRVLEYFIPPSCFQPIIKMFKKTIYQIDRGQNFKQCQKDIQRSCKKVNKKMKYIKDVCLNPQKQNKVLNVYNKVQMLWRQRKNNETNN